MFEDWLKNGSGMSFVQAIYFFDIVSYQGIMCTSFSVSISCVVKSRDKLYTIFTYPYAQHKSQLFFVDGFVNGVISYYYLFSESDLSFFLCYLFISALVMLFLDILVMAPYHLCCNTII